MPHLPHQYIRQDNQIYCPNILGVIELSDFLPQDFLEGEIVNTLLKQAQRDIHRLKKNDSFYGMTEISIFVDFSRRPQETENLVGYSDFVEAVDNGHDLQECLQISHLHPDSIVLDEDIQEPFLLCRVRVTKLQEQALIANHERIKDYEEHFH